MPEPFPSRVADVIVRTSIANAGARVGVAVSGGADSVVLLAVLVELRERFGYELTVLHVNHGLRGAESDRDQEFVHELARQHGLAALLEQGRVTDGDNVEQAARDARRAFFHRLTAEGVIDAVALAHTLSDQAETLLLRLFRGTGLSGLAGMRTESDERFVRPLLGLAREEVREFAAERGLRWREDSSNEDLHFRRNLLRREIMPKLRDAFHPHIERVLANTALLAQAEEDYWEQEARRLLAGLVVESETGLFLKADGLSGLPLAAARRVVRSAIERVKGNLRTIDSAHVDAILALCADLEGHNRVQVPGVDALRSFDRLRLGIAGETPEKRHYSVAVQWGRCTALPFHLGEVTLERGDAGYDPSSTDTIAAADECRLNSNFLKVTEGEEVGALVVRNWEPGDSYAPLGHSHPVKIKELFQERRVYLWDRSHWPVLEAGGQIVWSRLFGPAAEMTAGSSEVAAARLTYYR